MRWGSLVGVGYPSGPPPATGMGNLVLSDATIHTFSAALQRFMTEEVLVALTPPSPSAPAGKFTTLLLLNLCFMYGVAGDGCLPLIWGAVARVRVRTEGITTLNQNLMRGFPSCYRLFGGIAHFSASLPLLVLLKNVLLWNPSVDPYFSGGEFTPWLTHQGAFEAATRGGADAFLLAQQLDGHFSLTDLL